MASIGMTIPAVAFASIWLDGPIVLGLGSTQIVELALTVVDADRAKDLHQRRHVEDIAEALAVGLEEDREGWVAAGDAEEIVLR